jgi:glycosyltransferase involved in cell wall biosynthesis
MKKTPVSVLVPTKNEEANIAKCLDSVAWAAEVFVVDSNSSDRTAEIARTKGATVVPFRWDGTGLKKYNWSLENLPWRHDWVLVVDADEEVTPELAEEIAATVARESPYAGFVARFDYFLLGRRIRHGDPLEKPILFRHRVTRYERLDVPEITEYDIEVHEQPVVRGPVGRLKGRMVHRDWVDLHHHFERHNIYSDWEALLRTRYRSRDMGSELRPRLLGSPVERRRFFKRLFLSLPGKPLIYFLYGYVLRLGFLDGRAGFSYNTLKAIYWYEISLKEYEIRNNYSHEHPEQGRQEGDSSALQEDAPFGDAASV